MLRLEPSRLLVSSVLIASIIAGFLGRLPIEDASAVITSYSTWTSTYTSHSQVATRTDTVWTVTSVETLTQTTRSGPYLKSDLEFWYYYDLSGENVVGFQVKGTIWNLMNIRVERGTIKTTWTNKAKTVTQEVYANFGWIGIGQNIYVDETRMLATSLKRGDVYVYVDYLICPYGLTTVPVATYTYYATRSETYLRTYTAEYTISEPGVLTPESPVLIMAVVAIAAVAIAVVAIIRSKTAKKPSASPIPEPIPPPPAAEVEKHIYCIHCGKALPIDSEFCYYCGEKQ